MRTLSIRGLSVTMPHKTDAAAACDRLDGPAAKLGVVNCVHNDAGTLVGYNTDGDGLVESLQTGFGVEVSGRRVAVLGAGGAARSVIEAMGRSGAERIDVVNRTRSRATEAAELAPQATAGALDDVRAAAIVINATSRGMGVDPANGSDEDMPCRPELVADDAVAVDLIYHPLQTPWLRTLTNRGVRGTNGVDMLVAQAAIQLRHFTEREPNLEVMNAVVRRHLASETT